MHPRRALVSAGFPKARLHLRVRNTTPGLLLSLRQNSTQELFPLVPVIVGPKAKLHLRAITAGVLCRHCSSQNILTYFTFHRAKQANLTMQNMAEQSHMLVIVTTLSNNSNAFAWSRADFREQVGQLFTTMDISLVIPKR